MARLHSGDRQLSKPEPVGVLIELTDFDRLMANQLLPATEKLLAGVQYERHIAIIDGSRLLLTWTPLA